MGEGGGAFSLTEQDVRMEPGRREQAWKAALWRKQLLLTPCGSAECRERQQRCEGTRGTVPGPVGSTMDLVGIILTFINGTVLKGNAKGLDVPFWSFSLGRKLSPV